MATKQPEAPVVGDKGLQAGALGLVGNVVIGLAAVAPAYSLAATLGYVVLEVEDKAPAMFVLAFIPMLLVAFASAYNASISGRQMRRSSSCF